MRSGQGPPMTPWRSGLAVHSPVNLPPSLQSRVDHEPFDELSGDHRLAAARASEGRSDDVIQRAVIVELDRVEASGATLDFGAGRGDLLHRLAARRGFTQLARADIADLGGDPAEADWSRSDQQQVSARSLRGRCFSDNDDCVARRR
jgi:hypothetical protein